jgi:hypothetical protein
MAQAIGSMNCYFHSSIPISIPLFLFPFLYSYFHSSIPISIPPTIVRKIWYHTKTVINTFFWEFLLRFQFFHSLHLQYGNVRSFVSTFSFFSLQSHTRLSHASRRLNSARNLNPVFSVI